MGIFGRILKSEKLKQNEKELVQQQVTVQQVSMLSELKSTSFIMHFFHAPSDAESYYDKFCNWARANSSSLVDPVTIEIGILLKRSIDKKTYVDVQNKIDIYRATPAPDGLIDMLWQRGIGRGKGSIPKKMLDEIRVLSSKDLVDNVPFCYVVAAHYGNNKLPNDVVLRKSPGDSSGSVTTLSDYLSRRWFIDQKCYGAGDVQPKLKIIEVIKDGGT